MSIQPLQPSAPQGALLFDALVPASLLGSMTIATDSVMLAQWREIYGDGPSGETLPLAFAPLLLMRAMLTVTSPRPPGNLHVGQTYHIERMPRLGSPIFAQVFCSSKELRKGRRIVELETRLADGVEAPTIILGRSTIFWAM